MHGFPEIMRVLPVGSYSLGQLVDHFPGLAMSRVAMAKLLSRSHGRSAHGKTLSQRRKNNATIYVVTAAAIPVSNTDLAQVDEARREGIATGTLAGLLRAQHGIEMMTAQGTALRMLCALSEMGFGWRTKGDA